MNKKPPFSLRAWLILFVVGALVPLLVFATAMLAWMGKSGEVERDRALQDRARALALAVDREVATWKTATSALAVSSALEHGRLAEFYAEARQVGAQLDGWFSLCDATTQQFVNTMLPYGAPLPKSNPVALEIFRDPRPVVRDPVIGSVAQRPVLTVGVPVFHEGRVVYSLNLGIDPARLNRLLEAQQLPATWVAGIIDRQYRVVARSIYAEQRIGKPGPQALHEAAAKTATGLVAYVMSDGRPGRVAFQRLTEVPWILTFAAPVAEIPSSRYLAGFVLIGVLLAGIGIGVASVVGRKIAQPIRRLVHLAPALVRGEATDADVASGIREVRQLQQTLVEAAKKAHAYAQERERAAEALRRVNAYTRSLIEASLDPLVTIGPDGKITDVNAATEAATGYPRSELIGTDFSNYFTEPQRARAGYEQVFRDGFVRDYPLEIRHRDGRLMSVLYNASVYRDETGKAIGVFAAARDVTERNRAVEALRRLNEELEARVQERTAALQESNVKLEVVNSQAQEANIRLEEVNAELQQEIEERQQVETALAEANAALRESEARHRRLVELAPDAVLVHQDARIVYANAAALRLYGAETFEQLRDKDVLDLVHPDERVAVVARMRQMQSGGTVPLREVRHRRLDGQEMPVELTAAPVDWQGRRAVQIITRDITDRKKRERELSRLNRTLVARRKSTAAMMRAASESEYLEEVCRIVVEDCGHAMVWIGFAEEDESKSVRPVAHAGFEEGYLGTLAITWADTERGRGPTGTAIRTGKPSMCRNMLTDPRFALWRADALRRGYASSLVLPLLANGKAFGAVTIYSREPDSFSDDEVQLLAELADDLAYGIAAIRLRVAHARAEEALRQSEERYRALVELSPDAIFLNRDNRIVFLNPAAVRLFGASAAAQMLGRSPFEVFHPDCHALVRERLQRLLAGQVAPLIEEKIVRVDGTVVDVEVAASSFMDPDGVAIQVILREITGRKLAEEALRQAHTLLEQKVQERTAELSQAVQQLERQSTQLRALASELALAEQRERRRVAEVLHGDLQQLLVGAKLLLSALGQAADPAVQTAVREVTDLLLRALRCSRSLTEELSPPILHRGGLIPALEWLARWMGEKYHLTVILRAVEAPVLDSQDTAILLFQTIRELLLNAAKHAQAPDVRVEIAQQDDRVCVRVSDEGVGFDPAQLRVGGGTSGGFGLFGIRERLELLGGRLEIESAPGKGSRFMLWLPIPRAVPAGRTAVVPTPGETETSTLRTAGAGPAGSGERKIRVLVVDDHLVVRQGLVRLLKEAPDIEVVGEASDGEQAVALTRKLLPDVVTMDVHLPGMSGIEATGLIHAECPAVRVIGLSMFEESLQGPAMRDAGAVAYLIKSAPAETLVTTIRACARSAM